jgi:hypothetical protein
MQMMLATQPKKPRYSDKKIQQLKELSPPAYDPSNSQSKPDSTTIHLVKEVSHRSFEEKGRAILKGVLSLREREANGKPPPERNGPPQLNVSKEQKEDYIHEPLNTNPSSSHTVWVSFGTGSNR